MSAWLALVGLALALLWRRRRPGPFPAFLTPLLENPVRRAVLASAGFARSLDLAPGMRVLEIGPGGGLITELLMGESEAAVLVCLDIQQAMLAKVRRRLGARSPNLVCATASTPPFRDRSFERIILVNVLGEVPDRRSAMLECARMLSDDGALLITESLPDPDYIPPGMLLREAAQADLTPLDRVGSWASYTQRFVRADRAVRTV